MPRFAGKDARWEDFRRWLTRALLDLTPYDFIILSAGENLGYVQFIREDARLIGECCDPGELPESDVRKGQLQELIDDRGWGPGDHNPRLEWHDDPERVEANGLSVADAVDASTLAMVTIREVFAVDHPNDLDITEDTGEVAEDEAHHTSSAPAREEVIHIDVSEPLTVGERRALTAAVDFNLEKVGERVRTNWGKGDFTSRLEAVAEGASVTIKTPHAVMQEKLLTETRLHLSVSEKAWLATCVESLLTSGTSSALVRDLYSAHAKLLA